MKQIFLCCLATAAILMVGCAKDDKSATATGPKPSRFEEQKQTMTATVQAIDPKTRMLTLKDVDGDTSVTFKADEEMRNLDQVKVGDRLTVEYYESVNIQVKPPGEAVNDVRAALDRSEPGEKPGGVLAQHTTMTATVEQLDKKKSLATLRGPQGNLRTVTVRDKKNLQNVNVGDRVIVTYTEVVTAAVRAPATMPSK
jgi:capsule polysaccharide export protein KpsC/LpsZ